MSKLPNSPQYQNLLKALYNIDIHILNNFTHTNFCTVNISSVSTQSISQQILDVIYDKIKDIPLITYKLLLKNNVSDILQNDKYTELPIKLNWNDIYGHLDLDEDFIQYYYLQDNNNLIYFFLLIEYYNNRIIANTPINIYINIFPYNYPRDLLKFKNYIINQLSSKKYSYIDNKQIITDDNILVALVKNNYIALKNASDSLKNDRRIVGIAVKYNYRALIYVPEKFKKCEKFMFYAIKQNYKAYDYIHNSLLNNKSILSEVINQYYKYFPFEKIGECKELYFKSVSERIHEGKIKRALQERKELIMKVVRLAGCALEYISDTDKQDFDIVLLAVQNDGISLQFAHNVYRSNYDIVLAAVKENGLALQFVSKTVTQYDYIVETAVTQNGLALQFVPKTIRQYNNIVAIAIEQNKNADKYIKISKQTKRQNKETKKVIVDFNFNY